MARTQTQTNGLDVPGWTSSNYSSFKTRLVEKFAVHMVVDPDWAWSDNERRGLNWALRRNLPIYERTGREVSVEELRAQSRKVEEDARTQLAEAGWDDQRIAAVAPSVAIVG